VISDSSMEMQWYASFSVEQCLDAEALLSADRRSLRSRKILRMKVAILQCISHPDRCYTGLCFIAHRWAGTS
jgi:hypothetical protein